MGLQQQKDWQQRTSEKESQLILNLWPDYQRQTALTNSPKAQCLDDQSLYSRGAVYLMQLLKSVVVDATPSATELLRYALLSTLTALRQLLLLYPLNIVLFLAVLLLLLNKLTSTFRRKPAFKAEYFPLQHRDNQVEELKLLKKQVRDVQADLIALLKHGNQEDNRTQGQGDKMEEQGKDQSLAHEFLSESRIRGEQLSEAEVQLKRTVSEAYQQLAKLNA